MKSFRQIATLFLATTLLGISSLAWSQPFPNKPVRLLVPWAAGGSVDVLARALANELSKTWGQPVVVENPAGAASIIGAQKVATSPNDGYTLLFTLDGTVVANRFLYKKLPYDPDKGLVPVSMIGRSAMFVIVPPTSPVNNMKELIEAARKAPGTVSYSSGGVGAPGHLFYEYIASRENVQFLHAPYKGVAPAMAATMSGEVALSAGSPGQTGAVIKGGKLKALAITATQRNPNFPDIPTVAEAGYPYAAYTFWWGLFAPEGTPQALVDKISKDAATIVHRPDFSARFLTDVGIDPVGNTPAEFNAAIKTDVVKFGEMVKAAKLQPQD